MAGKKGENEREPLVDRYYGLMLGFFFGFCTLEIPLETFVVHRSRMNEVMRELGIEHELPVSHQDFVDRFASISRALMLDLKLCSIELADFFAFGFHALQLLAGSDGNTNGRIDLVREDFKDVIDRYALDSEAVLHILQPGWDAGRLDDALWTEFVGRYYRLAMIAIWPVKKQPGVAFVIMPFGEPFGGYYFDFYRVILHGAGYTSIRGWVGLTNEFYLPLLATLISRCSLALADISAQPGTATPNLNVIHEIGLNMGLENMTVLIRDERNVMLPSNFTGVTIIEYESTPPEFPTAIAAVIAAQIEQEPRGNE